MTPQNGPQFELSFTQCTRREGQLPPSGGADGQPQHRRHPPQRHLMRTDHVQPHLHRYVSVSVTCPVYFHRQLIRLFCITILYYNLQLFIDIFHI
jgi:hypothetical protein